MPQFASGVPKKLRMRGSNDTIAAQVTPPGRGGVGIVRVSGSLVDSIASNILDQLPNPRYATFCNFFGAEKLLIDQGVAIRFQAPHSYTGEDVLELQGHGGPIVMDDLLHRVLELGARMAKPGEFTERAYLNHKIDLTQAEAIIDLINASSSQAAQNAMRSLQGDFSKKINLITNQLIQLRVNVETAIDFSEEDLSLINESRSHDDILEILAKINQLKESIKQGIVLRDGITVVITGKPNAGKSSLLNQLSGQDTAIVTDIPGTTRDVLHCRLQIDRMPVHLLDTAGLHDHPGIIEGEGIRRAYLEIKAADHVLIVVDGSDSSNRDPRELKSEFFPILAEHAKLTIIYNKIDLTNEVAKHTLIGDVNCIFLSAKTGDGFDILKNYLKNCAGYQTIESGFSARRRHLDALLRAEKYLLEAANSFHHQAVEFIASDLNLAQQALTEITGDFSNEDLLDRIFAEFCIGK